MLNFCPQCGTKVQPGFKFCPSCGDKLPTNDPTEPETSQPPEPLQNSVLRPASGRGEFRRLQNMFYIQVDTSDDSSPSALIRPPLRTSRRKTLSGIGTPTETVESTDKKSLTSSQKRKASPQVKEEEVSKRTSSVITQTPDKKSLTSPRKGKGSPLVKEQEAANQKSSVTLQTPDKKSLTSPRKHKASPQVKDEEAKQTSSVLLKSPAKGKSKKRVCAVEPVQEGTVVCDQSSKKWKLVELLWQTEIDLTYAVCQANQHSDSNVCKHILRLGAKEGQLFNEQNFHLRAAKPDAVFPSMGETLQSVMEEGTGSLSEKAVLQLALRLLDSLEFIHEKEYAHADIHAGNIYINADSHSEVFLSGFGHAFRFCPGGNHVEYRQCSRTADQGNINFISLDSHKGAGPSRRSDLQSLGYCMLSWMTGTLPWSHLTHTSSTIATEKERYISDIAGLVSFCSKKKKDSSALLDYLSNVMTLQYTEKPNYSLLKAGLHKSLLKMGGSLEEPLDLQVKP